MVDGATPPKPRKTRKSRRRPRPRGRPPHYPTTQTRAQVEALASFGRPQTDIAEFLNISVHTLCRHYARELAAGPTKAVLNVGISLYDMAVGRAAQFDENRNRIRAEVTPIPAAAIFFLKARAGWRETMTVANDIGEDGKPIPFTFTTRDGKL